MDALLSPGKGIEQEEDAQEDERPSVASASGKEKTVQRAPKEPLVSVAGRDDKGSRKKNRTPLAPARERDEDIPPPQPEVSSLSRSRMPKTTPAQRRAIARELFAASDLLGVQEVVDAINTRGDYAQNVLLLLITRSMPGPLDALLQHPVIAKIACIACIADRDGRTALHHAAHRGRRDVVQLLLRKLPASEIARTYGANKTAADLARESGHGELADLLASVARVRQAMGTQ